MMPSDPLLPPPVGDVAAYPNDALPLGGGRWLTTSGNIVFDLRHSHPCELKANTLAYWEAAALRGQGVPLEDLIV